MSKKNCIICNHFLDPRIENKIVISNVHLLYTTLKHLAYVEKNAEFIGNLFLKTRKDHKNVKTWPRRY